MVPPPVQYLLSNLSFDGIHILRQEENALTRTAVRMFITCFTQHFTTSMFFTFCCLKHFLDFFALCGLCDCGSVLQRELTFLVSECPASHCHVVRPVVRPYCVVSTVVHIDPSIYLLLPRKRERG
jgi:hypothetical protein